MGKIFFEIFLWFKLDWEHNVHGDIVSDVEKIPTWN